MVEIGRIWVQASLQRREHLAIFLDFGRLLYIENTGVTHADANALLVFPYSLEPGSLHVRGPQSFNVVATCTVSFI